MFLDADKSSTIPFLSLINDRIFSRSPKSRKSGAAENKKIYLIKWPKLVIRPLHIPLIQSVLRPPPSNFIIIRSHIIWVHGRPFWR